MSKSVEAHYKGQIVSARDLPTGCQQQCSLVVPTVRATISDRTERQAPQKKPTKRPEREGRSGQPAPRSAFPARCGDRRPAADDPDPAPATAPDGGHRWPGHRLRDHPLPPRRGSPCPLHRIHIRLSHPVESRWLPHHLGCGPRCEAGAKSKQAILSVTLHHHPQGQRCICRERDTERVLQCQVLRCQERTRRNFVIDQGQGASPRQWSARRRPPP
jgi:hypothetical protein